MKTLKDTHCVKAGKVEESKVQMTEKESSAPLDILKRVNARNRNLICPMTDEEIVAECKSAWTKVNGTKH